MRITRISVVKHARYIIWRNRFLERLNARWERISRLPCEGLMTASMVDFHMVQWGIAAGIMDDPGTQPRQTDSAYVAVLYDRHADEVEQEIRKYLVVLAQQREANRMRFSQKGLY